jgi:hypothetical protein
MSNQITPEQTKQLFQFCRQHQVYHYDVQIELVDHLAWAIEEQWEENPELSFDSAVKQSFEKFGENGFRKIYETRKKELNKKYSRLHLQYFYKFFRLPNILMTVVLTYVVFILINLIGNTKTIHSICFAFVILTLAFYYLFWFPKRGKINTKNDTKFLLLDVLNMRYKQFWLCAAMPLNICNIVFFDIFPQWSSFSFNSFRTQLLILGISFSMVCFEILAYSYSVYASQKIKDYFIKQYPEFVK